jgi:hypothetical protein
MMNGCTQLDLPSNLPNAWGPDENCGPAACYAYLGWMGLMRQHMGHGVAAVLDTASGGVDTGNLPPPNAPPFARFNDVDPRFDYGVRGTIGYHCGTNAFEVSGFYLTQNSSAKVYQAPGMLDSFFNINGNFTAFPVGFEGNNGMWLQDDVVRLRLQQAMGSGEANYRWWLGPDSDFSWSVGVRYLDLYERLSFFAGDDDLTVLVNGRPDPLLQATYTTTAHNHILAPQLGLEWNKAINCWLAFTATAKGAWGANFLNIGTRLQRGDGFLGFDTQRNDTVFSHLYEIGLNLDFRLAERVRLRAGYMALWVVDVATAVNQLDFNLANKTGRENNDGSIFYHGPMLELQVMF